MVCARVIGNDATVAWAGASGSFELNVAIPVMGTALLESIRLLVQRRARPRRQDDRRSSRSTSTAPRRLAGMSPSIVTPLNKLIGYEAAREDRQALGGQGHHGPRGRRRPRLRRPR